MQNAGQNLIPATFLTLRRTNAFGTLRERLYRSFAMPADAPGSINVLAREVVNPLWEPTRIRIRKENNPVLSDRLTPVSDRDPVIQFVSHSRQLILHY
jgi:hypothetical protein